MVIASMMGPSRRQAEHEYQIASGFAGDEVSVAADDEDNDADGVEYGDVDDGDDDDDDHDDDGWDGDPDHELLDESVIA